MSFTEENEPLVDMKDLLDESWVSYSEVPKPNLLIVNDVEEAISRINLNDGDYILFSLASPEQIRPRGNFIYQDRIAGILFAILTKESRQRMRNIYKEIRTICNINKHIFPNWQLIRPMNYRELVNTGDISIWRGEFVVQIENHGILAELSI